MKLHFLRRKPKRTPEETRTAIVEQLAAVEAADREAAAAGDRIGEAARRMHADLTKRLAANPSLADRRTLAHDRARLDRIIGLDGRRV